jgi:hypothetical protein
MAPVPEGVSSSLNSLFNSISRRTASALSSVNPILARQDASTNYVPGSGTIQPDSIPSNAIFALFGIIGAGFVITGVWFFFIAKNGGFHFKEGDWEDYKSTVLRRKGPNGTTLSGATRTTDLGGGSVVGKRYRDSDTSSSSVSKSQVTESLVGTETVVSEMTSITRGVSGRFKKEKTAKGEKKRLREKGNKREKSQLRDEESAIGLDEQPDEVIRSYRHEKPAKVGGMNRAPDGSAFGSSFDGSTHESHSELLANREVTPTNTPTKIRKPRDDNYTGGNGSPSSRTPGIRKVETVREQDRIKAEARKLQEKGRSAAGSSSAGKKNFSYTPGDDGMSAISERSERAERTSPTRNLPGGYVESEVGSDVTGTKSYHHPIPGLSSTATSESYVDERRRRRAERGGYRRD